MADVLGPMARLFRRPGPFASVYVTTELDVEDARKQLELRWSRLREQLDAAGAPAGLLDEIATAVLDVREEAGTTAVIADRNGVALVRREPEPPQRDVTRWAELPSVGPLIEWEQLNPPHVVVLADRAGADILTFVGAGETTESLGDDTSDPRLHRSAPGGWSQRRYQQRAEVEWEANAREVAQRLTQIVDDENPRVIVLVGEPYAVGALRSELRPNVDRLVHEMRGGRHPDRHDDALADEIVKIVATAAAEDTVDLLQQFQTQRAHGLAVEGVRATVEALRRGQCDTLLIHDDWDDDRRAWFGPDPTQLRLESESVRPNEEAGSERSARLVDVLIGAAFGTSAGVRIVPENAAPDERVGAILRYRTD